MGDQQLFRILAINPGSTSTKLGIYENETCVCDKNLHHSATQLEKFEKIWDQYEFRKREIIKFLNAKGYDLKTFGAVVGRGGLLKPIESGTYRVDERMIHDLRRGVQGHHASNLGGVLAYGLGWDYGMPAFIVDPPAVDELEPISRISGWAEIPRISLFHALNIKATARRYARDAGRPLEELNLIVAHLGGGITVAAIRKGRIVDVNEGLSEGPFTPERSGAVPTLPLVELCFSGKYTKDEIKKKLVGKGGLVSYLNTNDAREVENMARAGHPKARLVYEAMAYQVAKEIGARAVTLSGKVDATLITGGLARSEMLCSWMEERCSFIGPIKRYPGENELEALALGALRVLRGEERARLYDAQERTIGLYYSEFLREYEIAVTMLETRLRDLGYRFRQKDENLNILIRNCQGDRPRMDAAIEEFADKGVDLIVAVGSPAAEAARPFVGKLRVPLVCMACYDAVTMGLAENYTEPGNNVTGSCYRVEILEQLKSGLLALCPKIKRLGLIYRSGELPSETHADETREACKQLGLSVVAFDAQEPEDLDKAVKFYKEHKVDAVFLGSDSTVARAKAKHLKKLTAAYPTCCSLESTISRGGLVGRIASWEAVCEEAVKLAIKVLEGTPASKLAIVRNPQPQTVLNSKTAEALGLEPSEEYLKTVVKRYGVGEEPPED